MRCKVLERKAFVLRDWTPKDWKASLLWKEVPHGWALLALGAQGSFLWAQQGLLGTLSHGN